MSVRQKQRGSVRVKRGISPSPSPSPSGTTLRRTSPKSTSRSLESSSSGKSIPNYLKPTLSSSGDATKIHGRKPAPNTDSAIKPKLARRSSDKLPSPTPTLKAPAPTFRSSSLSGKTTTNSPKGDTSSKGTRDSAGKQHSLHARPVATAKKSSTLGNKGETKTTSRKEPKLNAKIMQHVDRDKEHEDSPLAEAAQEELDEDTITKQLETEIQKVDSPTHLEEDDAEIANSESPTTLEESDASSTVKPEYPTNIEQGDANVSDHEEMDNESCIEEEEMQQGSGNEMNDTKPDGSVKEEADDKERDEEEKEEAASEVDAGGGSTKTSTREEGFGAFQQRDRGDGSQAAKAE